jgi:uncharacterized protein involved in outer membrane biogenesis
VARIFKLIGFLIALLIIVLAGITAFLQYADLNPYRNKIEAVASTALSRQLRIDGPIEVKLFPFPELVLNEVSIANAPWGSEPEMLQIGHLDVSVMLLSVFTDMIIIRHLHLDDVTLLLEQNKARAGNWGLGNSDPSKKKDQKERMNDKDTKKIVTLPVMTDLVEFDNISLTLRRPGLTDKVIHIESLQWKPDPAGNIQLRANGKLLNEPMNLDSVITSMDSLKEMGTVKMEIDASVGDVEITADMQTGQLETLSNLEGDIRIAAKDIQKALSGLGVDVPIGGPLNADLNAKQNPKGFDLKWKALLEGISIEGETSVADVMFEKTNLDITIDEISDLLKTFDIELPISGALTAQTSVSNENSVYKISANTKVDGLNMQASGSYADSHVKINASIAPLRRLGEWFDLQSFPEQPLVVKAEVTASGKDMYDLKTIQANLDKNQFSCAGKVSAGNKSSLSVAMESPNLQSLWASLPAVAFDARAKTEYDSKKFVANEISAKIDKSDLQGDFSMLLEGSRAITAKLTSTLLDLRPFDQPSKEKEKKAPQTAEAGESVKDSRYIFKNTPLQLDALKATEADVDIAVGHFICDTIEFKDFVLEATSHGGRLNARTKLTTENEGKAASKIDLSTSNDRVTVDTVISISDLRISAFENEGIKRSEVPPLSMSIALQSSGASPRELASVANGRILLTQGSGRVANKALSKVSGDLFTQLNQALNPFAKTEPLSDWDCSVISMHIKDGQADIDELLSQGEKVTVTGGGHIDLKTEKMNIEFNTKPRTGFGITADMFVTPFINLKGTLARPQIGLSEKGTLITGGAAIATAGLSVIAQTAYKRATAEIDQCERTREQAGKHIRYDF